MFALRVGLGARGCGAAVPCSVMPFNPGSLVVSSRSFCGRFLRGALSFRVVLFFSAPSGNDMYISSSASVGIFRPPAFLSVRLGHSAQWGAAAAPLLGLPACRVTPKAGLVWSVCACDPVLVLVCVRLCVVSFGLARSPSPAGECTAAALGRGVTYGRGVRSFAVCSPRPENAEISV